MERNIYNKMWDDINTSIVSVWDIDLEHCGDGILLDNLQSTLEKYIKIEDDRETKV